MNLTYRLYSLTNKIRNKVGYRTIKTAVATPLSMFIAQSLGVNNVATAGILTMLCIQPSRRRSFETASDRFLACLLAIGFSAVFFEVFGYSAVVLSVLLMVFIPTTLFFKIESGILTSTVITLNIYLFENFNLSFVSNQLYLIVIGIGTGFLINLYMPSLEKKLDQLRKSVEVRFLIILRQIAKILRHGETVWLRSEIAELEDLLEEATDLAKRDKENRLYGNDHSYSDYFQMRQYQFELMQRMLILIDKLPRKAEISIEVASFIEELSEKIDTDDTASFYLEKLQVLEESFKETELPKSYQAFETKSIILQLLQEFEHFLSVKRNLMQPKEKEKKTEKEEEKPKV
ncbi:MAG: aromatic acid exporter family protein [Aequorivita sp.]